ncbi:MAG TPA: hypothetical protein VMH22_09760 [bacterium]|nr:hypothetical protein [bacterium]
MAGDVQGNLSRGLEGYPHRDSARDWRYLSDGNSRRDPRRHSRDDLHCYSWSDSEDDLQGDSQGESRGKLPSFAGHGRVTIATQVEPLEPT